MQSLVLAVAAGLLEAEVKEIAAEKERFMAEACPPLDLPSGGQQELMVRRAPSTDLHHVQPYTTIHVWYHMKP